MQSTFGFFWNRRYVLLLVSAILLALSLAFAGQASANDADTPAHEGRLITIHDRGQEKTILTKAASIKAALQEARISSAPQDIVEPSLETQLTAPSYTINIYRARPVIVTDGAIRQKIMTAAQTPNGIVAAAGMPELKHEDTTSFNASTNIFSDGASTIFTIDRAIQLTLQLYGKPAKVYTHASTVGEMLEQKGIKLTAQDAVSVDLNTPIAADMLVAVWRNGAQTATLEEPIPFPIRKVLDIDQPVGYHAVQTPGTPGVKSVTYEITAQNGQETSRKIIQNVTLEQPKEQVEVIGAKPGPNALTKSKGAQHYTDSKGIVHRETYYDLPMNVVIGACGGGGYTVRGDGAKVDKDGYILIAANYGNYPKCSIVETSMGLGKVYDTGGFAVRHPHGFDLATDWTNNNGQ